MSLNDPLANALVHVHNCDKIGKKECIVKPTSKFMSLVFDILKKNKYIKNYELINTDRGNMFKIELTGAINKCGVIKPRFSVKLETMEKYEKRYLPAKQFGILIISTPKGLMTHVQAMDKKTGGKLIAYCY